MVVQIVPQARTSRGEPLLEKADPASPHPTCRRKQGISANFLARIAIAAADPVSRAGLTALLQGQAGLKVVGDERVDSDLLVLAAFRLNAQAVAVLRRSAAGTRRPVVLVVDEISQKEMILAVECRVLAVLPRAAVTGDRLVRSVRSVMQGEGVLPAELVGDLLNYVRTLQSDVLREAGLDAAGLTPREVEVIRLMAEGLETTEIGCRLGYSGRTVKGVIHQIARKHQLRNRSHIIAHALRTGVI